MSIWEKPVSSTVVSCFQLIATQDAVRAGLKKIHQRLNVFAMVENILTLLVGSWMSKKIVSMI